jgi:glycolate oxidase iron-sulfur subunit
VPVLHTVELLDWATGGPMPRALSPPPGTGARTAGSARTMPAH